MRTYKLSEAAARLNGGNFGVNRRLLYLAAGDDLSSSVGLFWHLCDSFYLVDPFYGKGISYASLVEQLTSGFNDMKTLRLEIVSEETGYWEGACPGRRFHVRLKGSPPRTPTRRVCFAACGTTEWLLRTATGYNVVLNKDYAGITDSSDSDYPYSETWGLLDTGGIFAETIGVGRGSDATGFCQYRYRGFDPLFKVSRDTGAQLGFSGGLTLFQKVRPGNKSTYEGIEAEIDKIEKEMNAICGPFVNGLDGFKEEASDFDKAILEYRQYGGNDTADIISQHRLKYTQLLNDINTRNTIGMNNVAATDYFSNFVKSIITIKYPNLSDDYIRAMISSRNFY
ncbi:hypothetical protein [Insolitispirillum peregrinum]|uniref:hypothetical protein n=1 Tax=Insolitispirillum peregrinum TaxID=80876 RepID=UPI0036152AB5